MTILCITAATLLAPLYVYLHKVTRIFVMDGAELQVPVIEHLLAASLILTMYTSQWLWSNPEIDGLARRIDGFSAKITIIAFLAYALVLKQLWKNVLFVGILAALFGFAAGSHYFSTIKWCSPSHLFCHGGLHFVSSIGAIYAFI